MGQGSVKTLLLSARSDWDLEDLTSESGPGDFLLCHTWDTVPPVPGHRTEARGRQCKGFKPAGWPSRWPMPGAPPLGKRGWVCFCSPAPSTHPSPGSSVLRSVWRRRPRQVVRESHGSSSKNRRVGHTALHGRRLGRGVLRGPSQALPDLGPRSRAIAPQREHHSAAVSAGLPGAH